MPTQSVSRRVLFFSVNVCSCVFPEDQPVLCVHHSGSPHQKPPSLRDPGKKGNNHLNLCAMFTKWPVPWNINLSCLPEYAMRKGGEGKKINLDLRDKVLESGGSVVL
ncbi:hypothetical protein VTJ04DRAFT_7853 [Mycothermus thermophilus]|uniref:uncharacterized protein n=1 Tax=Humicola insolens TaxID=85995 RepID=UPI0037442C5F